MQQRIKIESKTDLYNYCDQVLNYLIKIFPNRETIETILQSTNSKDIPLIFDTLEKNGFIDGMKGVYYVNCKIKPKGIQLLKDKKTVEQYFNEIEIKEKEIEKTKRLEREKLHFESKLSKLKYYTFWPLFFVSLIGFGISIYNLYTNKSIKEIRDEIKKEIQSQMNNDTIKINKPLD